MKKILVQFAHPAQSRSRINRTLRTEISDLEGVTINDLYSNYPDFLIDVKREQKLCEEHDVIIFQHPFYWYSTPSIVKEWMDLVLQHGWAYGSKGLALQDKLCFQAISAGGDSASYKREGTNAYSIAELTSPFRATANLCKMKCLPPFAVLGIHRGISRDLVKEKALEYRRCLVALREERLDLEKVCEGEFLNSHLDSTIREA